MSDIKSQRIKPSKQRNKNTMVDGAFYAQKCYYWVRDQEKIKSNELVVTTVVIDVFEIYDIKIAHNMYRSLPSTDVRYLAPKTLPAFYAVLWPRLNMYGRSIHRMDPANGYFSAFSLQCWNTTEYHLFARYATLEYMQKNPRSYRRQYSKVYRIGLLKKHLKEYAIPGKDDVYKRPCELVIKASCDLFGVKLERLTSFGSRVINEVVPITNKYHKVVSMSLFAFQADIMFFAHEMPQPNPGPLLVDRIESIRRLGSVTPEDLLGGKRYDC